MGSYFGTPTKNWGSGTEEEFRIAYKSWQKTRTPEIMFYFSDAMSSVNQIDPDQLKKRNSFKKDIEDLGVYYFSYTDIAEFQFYLHNHISATIREVLKSKDANKSEVNIPEESAIILKNYNDLMAQDPLINAVSMLGSATDHMNNYANLLSEITLDIGKLRKAIIKETKNLLIATKKANYKAILKSFSNINNAMSLYSKAIAIKIPVISKEFSDSVIFVLRAIEIVKGNNLDGEVPLDTISSNIGGMSAGLMTLVESIKTMEDSFSDWPDDITDLKIQKRIVIALHKDLSASLLKSIELLDKLECEFV